MQENSALYSDAVMAGATSPPAIAAPQAGSSVIRLALPPAAVVLTDTVRSATSRHRGIGSLPWVCATGVSAPSRAASTGNSAAQQAWSHRAIEIAEWPVTSATITILALTACGNPAGSRA